MLEDVRPASYLRLNNLAIGGQARLTWLITTHVCRGNYHSTWASRGGYAPIAPILFAHENVDAFYLEFDDERSGSFEPLQYVAEGKKVVLGLITTKSPRAGGQGSSHRPHPRSSRSTSRWIASASARSAALPPARSATS